MSDEIKPIAKVKGFAIRPDGRVSGDGTTSLGQFDPELLRQTQEAARRGLDAVVVVEQPLPGGAFAIVRLRTQDPLGSYAIVSRDGLDDHRLLEALGSPSRDYREHPEAADEATITLYPDRKYVRESRSLGRLQRESPGLSTVGGKFTAVTEFLKAADMGAVVEIPGIGSGRVVRPVE